MTEIRVTRLIDGFIFEATGHADYAEHGNDIVCAGISALCIALWERLSQLAVEGCVSISASRIAPGEMYADVRLSEQGINRELTEEVLETVCSGFRRLEEMYPENISLNE